MRISALLLCAALACAGESPAITAFTTAMAGDDAVVKREAISALVGKDAGSDDVVLPLLVSAVGDRQGREPAIRALRARTGLTPAPGRSSSTYPNYPNGDTVANWQAWLAARSRDMETRKKLDKLDVKQAPTTAEKPVEAPPAEEAPIAPPPRIPTDDLGKLDRIVYTSGRTLKAYVRSKRLDGDGKLLSVRVVHPDGAGEEVIDAAVIARIDEDVE